MTRAAAHSDQPYVVDYHIIMVVYFHEPALAANDVGNMWLCLRSLGAYRARTHVSRRGDVQSSHKKTIRLGDPDYVNCILDGGENLVTLASSSFRKDARNVIMDSDVNFVYSACEKWHGYDAPSMVCLSLSAQVVASIGVAVSLDLVRSLLDVSDAYSPICGFVDLAKPDDAYAGMVYSATFPGTVPVGRWAEQVNWLFSGAYKNDRMRRVYWGNYLGANVLTRLGGKESFVNRCAEESRNSDGTANALCWSFANGFFISLCADPLDCRPDMPTGIHFAAQRNIRWLVPVLGRAGVLNAW